MLFEENVTTELKSSPPQNDQIIKTSIAFANTYGGKIIIGVSDSGNILGLSEETCFAYIDSFYQMISDNITPSLIPDIYLERHDDKAIIIICIAQGQQRPYYKKSLGKIDGTFIRIGGRTLKASYEQIEDLSWRSKGIKYDLSPEYNSSFSDFNTETFEQFLQARITGKSSNTTRKILKNKDQIDSTLLDSFKIIFKEGQREYLTKGAALLFAKDPQNFYPEQIILCTQFKGISGREAIDSLDCTGNLFQQFEQSFNFILNHLKQGFKIEGKKRINKYDIPEVAIREILINAIIHRDYSIPAASKIAIYENRIEISSPGQIAGPIDLAHLKSGITFIRNHLISRVFREIGLVEKLGSGIPTTFELFLEENLHGPQFIFDGNFFKVILPRTHHKNKVQNEVNDDWAQQLENLIEFNEQLTVTSVVKNLGCSKTTAVRLLKKMTKEKKIKMIKRGPATFYVKL